MRALALLRVLTGPVVLLHLRPFLSDAWQGRIYRDAFFEPYAAWYPELPRAVYVAMLWLAAVAAVAMAFGFLTRVATVTTFAIVTYNLFLSTTLFHNNRAYLVIVLGVLAVAPCGRELSLDAWIRRRRGRPALDPCAPAWPLWLLRFECAAIYGASGTEQARRSRLVRRHGALAARGAGRDQLTPLPGWAVSVLTDRDFQTGAAKLVVLTELFIAAGLWWRGTRYAAVWVAVVFHVTIQASASVRSSRCSASPCSSSGRCRPPATGCSGSTRRRSPAAMARGGARARLAGPLSRRAGCARVAAGGRGPGRHAIRGAPAARSC